MEPDLGVEIRTFLAAQPRKAARGDAPSALPLGARTAPRGVFEDDWSARPTALRPWPVILVHGTCDTKGIWQRLGAQLRDDGWAVFAPDYGNRGTGVLPESAAQLGSYVEAVLAVTGSAQAAIVGHSQGGLVARYWMRLGGGAGKVRHLVCLASPNHGTTEGGIASRLVRTERQESVMLSLIDRFFGPAGRQQIAGSDVLEELSRGGDTDAAVGYTCVATRNDAIVVPAESCFLSAAGGDRGTVRNFYVQDVEEGAVVLHENMPTDRRVQAIVRAVLARLAAQSECAGRS